MVKEEGKFKWLEEGEGGQPIILLHGLMGGVENFGEMVDFISAEYKVYGLDLKLFEGSLLKVSVKSLSDYLYEFMNHLGLPSATLIGNSMGGHIALIFSKEHPEMVENMILTGSSGLYEKSMGDTYPKRGDYNYIKTKTEEVFYDSNVVTKELVDNLYDAVNNRNKVIRILALAKSAIRHNMSKDLPKMNIPACLIWGKNDTVTPPEVAEEFHQTLPDSDLYWLDKCGHAPMMEHPKEFNSILTSWLTSRNL